MQDEALVAVAIVSLLTIMAGFTDLAPNLMAVGMTSLDISGIPTQLNLSFNGLQENATYPTGTSVTILAELSAANRTMYIDSNKTGWIATNGTTPLGVNVTFTDAGTYNVTAWFPGDVNYTPVSITRYITVTAVTPPSTPPASTPGGSQGQGGAMSNKTSKQSTLRVVRVSDTKVRIEGDNLTARSYFADTSVAEALPIYGFSFVLVNDTDQLRITIETVRKPANLKGIEEEYANQTAYQYMKVTVTGADPAASFRTLALLFRVKQDWVVQNYISPESVGMYRHGSWLPVRTVKAWEGQSYLAYLASGVPVLSDYYVISGTAGPPAYVTRSYATPYYMQIAIFALALSLALLILGRRGPKKKKKKKPVWNLKALLERREMYSHGLHEKLPEQQEPKKGKK